MRFMRVILFFLLLASWSSVSSASVVRVLRFNGVINPVSAEYIGGGILKINSQKSADLIVVMLDTPGGLDTSMRMIVKEILASKIPVAVYVAPSGSRAASAGTFIAMSAHISAMAPGTSQGSAHPVAMGEKMDETMSKKVENDAAAYIKSIAVERGRNAEWAENAVRSSVSLGEQDALKNKVIDFVAKDLDDLLKQAHGRKIKITGGEVTLDTANPSIIYSDMTQRQKALDALSNPTVAYILLMLGFYGLFFELSNPGVILPGVIGGICLVLGFYAMQSLPVNYAALLLLLLGVILFVAELYVPTHGALTVGGVVSLILGGVLLMDSADDFMKVQLAFVIPVAGAMGAVFFLALGYGFFSKSKRRFTGSEGLIGETGVAVSPLNPTGRVEVEGELWSARTDGGEIEKGAKVSVVTKDGPVLVVKRAG
ncbi:MAG: nodulation protein NfeD [Nitrospinae bacterium]|nr:nodulation protein NfeD [Nitrospinota bacterium]